MSHHYDKLTPFLNSTFPHYCTLFFLELSLDQMGCAVDFNKWIETYIECILIPYNADKDPLHPEEEVLPFSADGTRWGLRGLTFAGGKPVPKSKNGERILYQSRNNCFPLVAFVGKDNEINASFYCGPLFKWAEELGNTGYTYKGILYPFKVLFPCDMKAAWQGSGMGGSSGTTNSYCFLCDNQKCDKGSKHNACADCRTRHGLLQCRHIEFCYGACSPTPIADQLITWAIPTYPNPTNASKATCNNFY